MTESSDDVDEAYCPNCSERIETVSVAQLETDMSQTVVKFWTCPECRTTLGPTG